MAEFGEQLKKAREAKGMTQQTLADQLYVTRQSISRWESGSRYPDLLMLKEICRVLEVSSDELLCNEDHKQMVEKLPLNQPSLFKNIQIALYAIIVFLFIVQFASRFTTVNSMTLFEGTSKDILVKVMTLLIALVEAALFLSFFIVLLKGNDTPKKLGLLITSKFILELVERIFTVGSLKEIIFILISFLPFIIGGIGAYLYYVKSNENIGSYYMVLLACIYCIGIRSFTVYSLVIVDSPFVNMTFVFSNLLIILIYGAFIYETIVLKKKRWLAIHFDKLSTFHHNLS